MNKRGMGYRSTRPIGELICRVEGSKGDRQDMVIIADGVRIAKRGHPGTPQARTWVSLEPGWSVLDGPGLRYLEIKYERSAAAHQ
jgi:hypothetical protein